MIRLRLAFLLLVCLPAAGALPDIGPKARELLDINKKMAEPTCNRVRLVLEMAIAREKGETDRVKAMQDEVKKIDEDPRNMALTKRGKELASGPFNADEKEALTFQMGTIQNGCPWLRPAPKEARPGK